MRAVLIRNGDYYVGLRRRTEIARRQGADLFVSVHADSFRNPRVSGSSVYVLSRRGASSEAARWLAQQENASDFVGGVSIDDKDDLLASVLVDLQQTATLNASAEVGGQVLGSLGRVGRRHKRRIEQAGFLVLKSPDIPSILIETGFLTNPSDAKRLSNSKHQDKVARAILDGILRYFDRNPPPGTTFASARRHTIARGETLSEIAVRYTGVGRAAAGCEPNRRKHHPGRRRAAHSRALGRVTPGRGPVSGHPRFSPIHGAGRRFRMVSVASVRGLVRNAGEGSSRSDTP